MTNGEFVSAGSGITKFATHMNGDGTDFSGNSNTPTETNITWGYAYGRFGQGGLFNGSSSKITYANNIGITGNAALTIVAWIKPNSITTPRYVAGFGTNTGLGGAAIMTGIAAGSSGTFVNGNGNISLEFSGGNGGRTATGVIASGTRYCIIATKTAGAINTTSLIYLNAKNISLSTSSTSTPNISAGPPRIGSFPGDLYFYDGDIDEVIIDNVAWNQQKIQKYYTMALGRFSQ